MKKDKQTESNEIENPNQWSYEVLKQFRLIFKSIQQHSNWVETHCGLSSAQLWALWEISKNPGLKVTELAKAMSLHHSTASSLLNKMAKKGLIKRERIHQDQRLVTVILTPDGMQLVNQTPVPPQGILQHALFNLPEPVLKSLSKNLDALVKEMDIKDEMAAMEPLNPLAKRVKSLQNE